MEGVPKLPMVYVEYKENAVDMTGLEWASMTEEILEKQQEIIKDGIEKVKRQNLILPGILYCICPIVYKLR